MDFYLPDFRKSIEDPLTNNNTIKMYIFVIKFFPETGVMDFNDIEIKATMKQRVFNISLIILIKEINRLIKSLLNGKALGLNNIPNKVFKVVVLIIAKDLTKAVSYCFINETIPENFNKFITMVLHK